MAWADALHKTFIMRYINLYRYINSFSSNLLVERAFYFVFKHHRYPRNYTNAKNVQVLCCFWFNCLSLAISTRQCSECHIKWMVLYISCTHKKSILTADLLTSRKNKLLEINFLPFLICCGKVSNTWASYAINSTTFWLILDYSQCICQLIYFQSFKKI